MSKDSPSNLAHSIHQRLLNMAKRTDRPFNELLQYYAMERFLYRLSRSAHAGKFLLKGALLFTAWRAPMYRPTRDIDLLGRMSNDLDSIVAAFSDVCRQEVEGDGLTFDEGRVSAERITEDADYQGVRVFIHSRLGNARIALHIDIGFDDVVVPAPSDLDYPTILDLPAPRLRGYSRESVVAEKFEAMVKLGELNSRMKDFHDLWFLARNFDFDGAVLLQAIAATFSHRGTPPQAQPVALTAQFSRHDDKRRQWAAFLHRGQPSGMPDDFAQIVAEIAAFLLPVTQTLVVGKPFGAIWTPPGPWQQLPP